MGIDVTINVPIKYRKATKDQDADFRVFVVHGQDGTGKEKYIGLIKKIDGHLFICAADDVEWSRVYSEKLRETKTDAARFLAEIYLKRFIKKT